MAAKKKPTRHRSALKAARQALRRNRHNRAIKKGMRLKARAAGDSAAAKDGKTADMLSQACAAFDKASKSGVIHWKTAARRKSRLARRVAATLAAAPAKTA